MAEDWYRNESWDQETEERFYEKLRRARRKEQYVRIQASTLARTHPEVALKLLEHYFTLPDQFDAAQAYVDRATAFSSLGKTEDAIQAYEDALEREAEFPKLRTQAFIELPFLIATMEISSRYERALELLYSDHGRLTFPVDRFRLHAARALIRAAQGDSEAAATEAVSALEAASVEHSGFRYHPSVGLVGDGYDSLIERLTALSRGDL